VCPGWFYQASLCGQVISKPSLLIFKPQLVQASLVGFSLPFFPPL